MIFLAQQMRVLVVTQPVDFHKDHGGLTVLCKDLFTGTIFVFRAKRMDRLKLVFWDGSGIVLVYKRLKDSNFVWPAVRGGVISLNRA